MAKKVTIEALAEMIQQGFKETAKQADMDRRFAEVDKRFDAVDARFAAVDKRFDGIDERLDHVDARLGRLEADVSELRDEVVRRHEFEDALARIKYLEKKLGIESGA